jgi:calcium-translocating P-type ATPase
MNEPGRDGLTQAEASARLIADGPNVLPRRRSRPAALQLADQMVHFFALMLWAAGGLAFVAGMPQLGAAIFVVIVINGVFAFEQEHRAERAAERLRDLLPVDVTVRRDGRRCRVPVASIVRDDVVLLEPGDRISADLRLIEARMLALDTSTLTGESEPVGLDVGEAALAGTFVVSGEGVGVVTATGGHTRLAAISELTRAGRRPPSPLTRELDRVVRVVSVVAVGVGALFWLISALVGASLNDGFLFAIGVTVALVPEGLLPTVTLSLAMGAQRMARRNAVVRRLESVETLGSTTFICTDKTGTLTTNRMTVVEAWTLAGTARVHKPGYDPAAEIEAPAAATAALAALATAAVRCSDGRVVQAAGEYTAEGDPMEAALHAFALRLGLPAGSLEMTLTRRYPFDAVRKRMSVVAGGELLVKGAPESMLPLCRGMQDAALGALASMAARGLRMLAVARRPIGQPPLTAGEAERDLELLGLIGLQDPPREGARAAVEACRRAGIKVAMVTGDHPGTAQQIAREVGLVVPGSVALSGPDLPADDELLAALVDRDGIVISRVTPEDKLRIARALRRRGHVVAMTGDGVNDGPALQEADVGIAMGRSGTDVAREAADLVLLDDDFSTIVAAVEEGRATFANIRRFLTYHLTDNVAELTPFVVWALSGGRFPLALGVLQILCLDIGTDILPALALGSELPTERVLREPLQGRHLIDRPVMIRVFGVLGPTEAIVEMVAFMVAMALVGWRPGSAFPGDHDVLAASGAAFAAVVFGQMANAFACRSTTRPVAKLGWRTNPFLLWAVGAELALLGGFLLIPPVADLLGHAPPSPAPLMVALLAVPAVWAADTLHKRWLAARR